MKVLVIPDCHLKPEMYKKAAVIMEKGYAQRAVSLMDIADDWGRGYDFEGYKETYDAVLDFARQYPDTVFCYGNHDLSYVWGRSESGYSAAASYLAKGFVTDLCHILPEDNQPEYVRRIDNVIFSHGGLSEYFMVKNVPMSKWDYIDETLELINSFGADRIWRDESPIWYRPQYRNDDGGMFMPDKIFQVTGHTPTAKFHEGKGYVSCDVFSTDRSGRPLGSCEYLIIDTETLEYSGIPMNSVI